MNWLVFGDDWGAHPSTTQHLVRNLPPDDRVVWIDSIGMRAPTLRPADLRRAAAKLRRMLERTGDPRAPGPETPPNLLRVSPRVLPWHDRAPVRAMNRASLRSDVVRAFRTAGIDRAHALLSVPLGALYVGGLPIDRVAYLRLDDHPNLPGVDPSMVAPVERRLMADADAVLVTARALMPQIGGGDRFHYLPQGVDFPHFAQTPLGVPQGRTLGFFGLLAEWLDYELVEDLARRRPDWTLEFVGAVRHVPERLRGIPNVRLLPAVPYGELPGVVTHWRAAWIPFEVSELTRAVNPLKLREYLAAGLPAACTPLPEAQGIVPTPRDAVGFSAWLDEVLETDTEAARRGRRASMESESWGARAAELRHVVGGVG